MSTGYKYSWLGKYSKIKVYDVLNMGMIGADFPAKPLINQRVLWWASLWIAAEARPAPAQALPNAQ